ncbi:hypothetical protein BH24ACT7_BH24ACT7_26290 [soil metagenome]
MGATTFTDPWLSPDRLSRIDSVTSQADRGSLVWGLGRAWAKARYLPDGEKSWAHTAAAQFGLAKSFVASPA